MNVGQIRQAFPTLRISFLQLHGLINAIPTRWKQLLRQYRNVSLSEADKVSCSIQINGGTSIKLENAKSSVFYWNLLPSKTPTAVQKWTSNGTKPDSWRRIYEIPYLCTTSTRLQTLHYRIIHRYVPTKKYLVTRGLIGSPLCNYCFQVDDLQHHFFECPNIKPIWERILPQLKHKYTLLNEFVSSDTVLLGNPSAPPVVNLIILVIKQHILNCRISSGGNIDRLHFEVLKSMIKNQERAEHLIAKKNDQLGKHRDKWEAMLNNDGDILLD